MERHLISAFIDDELQLSEKPEFVQTVHGDSAFKDEVIDLLNQEIMLRSAEGMPAPPVVAVPHPRPHWRGWFKPMAVFGSGLAVAMLLLALFWKVPEPQAPEDRLHRFVIFQPDAQQAAIAGDFTHWQALEMQPAGRHGYWEIYLPLPPGEHRYSFMMDGSRQITDPTQPTQEQDDFGGRNSIIVVPPVVRI
jgi:hypothetical protein